MNEKYERSVSGHTIVTAHSTPLLFRPIIASPNGFRYHTAMKIKNEAFEMWVHAYIF